MVVIFALVADRSHHDRSVANDSKQRNIPGSTEWDDEFAFKAVRICDSASKRVCLQNPELRADRLYCSARQVEVSMPQSGLDEEVFKPQQIFQGFMRQGDRVGHESAAALRRSLPS